MKCPNCRVSVPSGKWTSVEIISDGFYKYSVAHFRCAECHDVSIKFTGNAKNFRYVPSSYVSDGISSNDDVLPDYFEEFILPKTTPREPIPKDVESIYRRDYDEAVKLLSISPMASAAFSRRLLQHYIEKKHKIKEQDLKQEIGKLKELGKYPSDLISLFDLIRHYGKFAAHATTNHISGEIIDVDPGEAESLLDILEEMFDYDYERTRRIKDREKKLQDKLRSAKPQQKEKSSN